MSETSPSTSYIRTLRAIMRDMPYGEKLFFLIRTEEASALTDLRHAASFSLGRLELPDG